MLGALAAVGVGCDQAAVGGQGWIELIASQGSTPHTDVQVSFEVGGSPPQASCTETSFGTCTVVVCTASGDPGTPWTQVGAGTIDISGGPIAVELAPAQTEAGQDAVWAFPSTLEVTASGDANGVPAFHQTVDAPAAFTLTAPAIGSLSAIDRSMPFDVAWTGGNASDPFAPIDVLLSRGLPTAPSYQSIDCAGFEGALEIPSAALEMLTPGAGTIAITSGDGTLFHAGSWDLSFDARWAAGSSPTIAVTFQ